MRYRRPLGQPPEQACDALTNPDRFAEWYLTDARLEADAGCWVDFTSGRSRFHVTRRILRWEPPRLFEHGWRIAAVRGPPLGEETVVRWELLPDSDGTAVTLTFRGLRRPTAMGFARGMHAFLDRLAASQDGSALPDGLARVEELRRSHPRTLWRRDASAPVAPRQDPRGRQPYGSCSGPRGRTISPSAGSPMTSERPSTWRRPTHAQSTASSSSCARPAPSTEPVKPWATSARRKRSTPCPFLGSPVISWAAPG
jgi:uncharacterized protein YndB with AHSA1/START domain